MARGTSVHWINLLASRLLKLRNTRNARKGLVDEALVFDLGVVAEVDQEPELLASRLQLVDHLRTVFVGQFLDRLDLEDDLAEAQEIRLVLLFQRLSLVLESKPRLPIEGDLLLPKLKRQAFLVHRLQEAIAFLFVHLETGANDPIALIFADDPFCCHFCAFCVFRSYPPPGQQSY